MARTVRDARLESRTARMALKPSGKPYFRAIDEGLHLGYRRNKVGGVWVMRWYVGKQSYKLAGLGTADDVIDADGAMVLSFAQAQAEARKRFVEQKRIGAGLPVAAGPYRVRDAIADYVAWLEANRKTAKDARYRAEALIIPELGDVECAKLTKEQIEHWRDNQAKEAPRLRTKKGAAQQFRDTSEDDDPEDAARRRRASTNRVLTVLKAALNHAWKGRKIPSDDAWRPVTAFRGADAARLRYLEVAEAQRLINAADATFRPLVEAALLTGCRFGELANLEVDDFNPDSGTLHIRMSKSGTGRHVVLTEEGIEFFRGLCAGRVSRDRLLRRDDGSRWGKSNQARPMREACAAAKIDPPASFHALRHTYASLAVMNGAPLMVVARNLGHSDTRMVEKHYGHLADSYVAGAIRKAAQRFGIKAGSVVQIGGK